MSLLLVSLALVTGSTDATPVRVTSTANGWQLLRGGKPYVVKGVGGVERLDLLRSFGGNSVRSWGIGETTAKELDDVQAKGLTMTVGIWLGHKGHGFDYADPVRVAKQREDVLSAVRQFKNHPAVLTWGLGNEMESDNDNPTLWREVGWLAKSIKQLDPNHPVMTVVAEVNPDKIKMIKEYAPDIDILGVNSYGGLATLPKRLREFGWTKPYIVTEFGPLGPWERPKAPWGAPSEPTSSEKAKLYASNYAGSIAGQPGFALGSYAFLWGDKQEATPTWFGMFLPTGESTEAVDVMSHAWTGKWPAQRAPQVTALDFDAAMRPVAAGTALRATVRASDPNGDPLRYEWILKSEVDEMKYAGEGEKRPETRQVLTGTATVQFKAPSERGNYRVYVTVRDGTKRAGVANAPFRVE